MRKLVVSESVTVDGVFDAYTMRQWATPFDSDERNTYIRNTILAADTLLMGRTTYEIYAPYWSSQKNNEYGIVDKWNSAPKIVVSTTLAKAEWNNSTIFCENVVDEIAKLKEQPGGDILIMGSAMLVQSLSQTDLIDEYKFLVYPAIMGSGKRFFKEGMGMNTLKLVDTKIFGSGIVLLCYHSAKKE